MIKSSFDYGACSSTAERLTVDEEVEGSKPSRHPNTLKRVFLIPWILDKKRKTGSGVVGVSIGIDDLNDR